MYIESNFTGQSVRAAAVRELESHLLGELIRPSHDDYDAVRQVYNLASDRRPALIVRAADAADVIRAITFAQEYDLPLAVRSGGHSMAGYGAVDGGLVIDLRRMQGVSMDPEDRMAWVQPGLTWGAYAARAGEYGLATSAGDVPSVGVGGLTLGGGIGWMVRKYGLAIDSLMSVELATADGRLLRASAEEHPDLFWALRGGGGNFGVATAFQFRLQPAGMVLGGSIIYPATRDVLRGWADYAINAPDELTTIVFVMPAPPAPFIPTQDVGKLIVFLNLCYVGDLAVGERIVQPLRQLGTPIADTSGPMPYPAVLALGEEGTVPRPFTIRAGYMQALSDDSIEAIVEHSLRMPGSDNMVELRALGGAMARVPVEATAFAHRDKRFLTTVLGGTNQPGDMAPQRGWTEDLWQVLRPNARGVYMNFLEDEGEARVREAYLPDTYRRLAEIKRKYDPKNVFRLNQNIPPAE